MDQLVFFKLKSALYGGAFILLFIKRPVRKYIMIMKGRPGQKSGAFQRPETQRYTTAIIISCAMSEAIGIFGLVLYLLGKNAMDLYVLIALSAVAMLQSRPKKEELGSLFEEKVRDDNPHPN
jgi:hypothetical protein